MPFDCWVWAILQRIFIFHRHRYEYSTLVLNFCFEISSSAAIPFIDRSTSIPSRLLPRDLLDGMYMLREVLVCWLEALLATLEGLAWSQLKVTQHTRLLVCGVLHHDVDTSVNRLCLCINNDAIMPSENMDFFRHTIDFAAVTADAFVLLHHRCLVGTKVWSFFPLPMWDGWYTRQSAG